MKFIIRKAKNTDLNDIFKVLKAWNMHHIPSLEIEEIDISCFYIGIVEKKVVGVSGYKVLNKNEAKTVLLAVYPEFQGSGIGKALQNKRLEKIHKLGIKTLITNSDRRDVIVWYKKYYGYKEIGKIKKLCSFGDKNISFWTTLQLDLNLYFKDKKKKEKKSLNYIKENLAHPLNPYTPLIINVALTGMIPTKQLTPYVPIYIDEIVEDAIKVANLGASIVHLHARDRNGNPTYKAKFYEEIISKIRKEKPQLICCASTSGRNFKEFEQRSEVLHITGKGKPDMASLTLGSLNFLSNASINTLDMIQMLAMLMKEKNILPELEVFDIGMVNIAKYLEQHSIINKQKYFNIILGNINSSQATINNLSHIYTQLPKNSTWSVGALGAFQLPMNINAICSGGHVRVGIEDNIFYDIKKTKLATNEEFVKRILRISNEVERNISTSKQTRELLGLN